VSFTQGYCDHTRRFLNQMQIGPDYGRAGGSVSDGMVGIYGNGPVQP
jgi:hypothetical protein